MREREQIFLFFSISYFFFFLFLLQKSYVLYIVITNLILFIDSVSREMVAAAD